MARTRFAGKGGSITELDKGKEVGMKIKYTAPKVVASSSVHPC